jgi:radical SAM protein with 4Fe4S-binding SPASM domain
MKLDESEQRGSAAGTVREDESNQNHRVASARRLRKVEVEITSECIVGRRSKGEGCIHCSLKAGTGVANSLTIEQIKSIQSDASDLGATTVVLTGGEPAQHPAFMDALEHAKRVGLETRVYTTGVADAWRRYPLDDVAPLVDEFYLSVEGLGETHDRVLRWPGAFEETVNFARKLQRLGIKWTAHFTPMRPNYLELEPIARKVRELGADSLKLIDFIPQGRGWTNRDVLELDSSRYFELFSAVRRLQHELCDSQGTPFVGFHDETYPPGLSVTAPLGPVENGGCTSGRESCAVLSDGTLIPCLGFRLFMAGDQPRSSHVAGNVRAHPFREIWLHSAVLQRFADSKAQDVNTACLGCSMLNECLGCCSCRRTELERSFIRAVTGDQGGG